VRTVCAATAVVLVLASGRADGAPFARIGYDVAPSSDTELMTAPDAAFRVSNLRVAGLYPIEVADGRVYLLPGIRYSLIDIDQTGGSGVGLPEAVHGVGLYLGAVVPLRGGWSVLGLFVPELATDFSRLGAGSLRLTGSLVARRRHDRKRVWGVGVAADYSFGTLLPLPALVLDWQFSERWRADVFVPSYAEVAVALWPGIELGARAQVNGNRFSIELDDVPEADNLRYSAADAGLRVGVQLNRILWLTGYAGYLFFRRVDVFEDGGDEFAQVAPDRQVIIRFGIEARPP
jgi:hypothetical protein